MEIKLEEMPRGLDYHLTDETFFSEFEDYITNIDEKGNVLTPKRGVFDKRLLDSDVEKSFAKATDLDS